jgi:hypothetical protein
VTERGEVSNSIKFPKLPLLGPGKHVLKRFRVATNDTKGYNKRRHTLSEKHIIYNDMIGCSKQPMSKVRSTGESS